MVVLRPELLAELDQIIFSNPWRQRRPPQRSPEELCQQFMPLLVKNVHLISDLSYPGSFTVTGFCYAFVYVIKPSSPAAVIPPRGGALGRNQITASPAAGGSWVSPPRIAGWHLTAPTTGSITPEASSSRAFPRLPNLQLSGSGSRRNTATLRPPPWLSREKGACVRVLVCPWDLLVKCFPFPGDIFDIKIKGQRGKQTYFSPPLSLEFGIVKQAALAEILFESSWLS